jgi:Ca2+-dependent lipid-binding protein
MPFSVQCYIIQMCFPMTLRNSSLVNWISVSIKHPFSSFRVTNMLRKSDQANGVLAITVHSCSKIDASDTTLNPFIRFYLNKAQELEKTSMCENTRTPHWNETKFLLVNNLESMLTMELRTTNSTKKAGKRLARSNFDLKDLKDEGDMELYNLELPMQRHGKFITNLKADMKYFPVSKPDQNPDGTFIEAAPSSKFCFGIEHILQFF